MFKIDSIDYFMFIVENASEGYYRGDKFKTENKG